MMLLLKQRGAKSDKAPLPRLTAMSRASLLGLLATATLLSLASFTQAAQAQTSRRGGTVRSYIWHAFNKGKIADPDSTLVYSIKIGELV